MNRPKILDNLLGTGRPSDWNVPNWNRPAAQEFLRAETAVQQAYARLSEIEVALDKQEQLKVCAEMGQGYTPTEARRAHARFTSSEWRQAWQDLLSCIEQAKQFEARWRAEMATTSNEQQQ